MSEWIGISQLPRWQRTAAVALILLQVFVLDLLLHAGSFALLAAAGALTGWLAPRQRWLVRSHTMMAYIAIIIFFILKYVYLPKDFGPDVRFISSELAYELSCACIAVQVFALFSAQYAEKLPAWFLLASGMGLVFALDARVFGPRREQVLIACLAFVAAWGVFAATERRPADSLRGLPWWRWLMSGCLLAVACGGGWGLSHAVAQYGNSIEQVLSEYIFLSNVTSRSGGFSGYGGLTDVSNWKQNEAEQVALRIEADFRPDYLRGGTFETFFDDRWHGGRSSGRITPRADTGLDSLRGDGESVFVLSDDLPEQHWSMVVWPLDAATSKSLFLPLESAAVICDADTLSLSDGRIVERPEDEEGILFSYQGVVPPERGRPANSDELAALETYLQLPVIAEEVTTLAEQLAVNTETNAQKIAVVEDFFQSNFQYHLGIRIPRQVDRLTYFLTERPPAHCEYFASAAAVLLRLMGVPTRYVTGFVISERNSIDGMWVARRKDSHAWVEAYDPDQGGWVTVEATPAEGVPNRSEPTSMMKQFLEAGRQILIQLQDFVLGGGLWRFLVRLVPILLLALVAWLFLRGLSRYRHWGVRLPTDSDSLDESLQKLRRERKRLDRFLRRRGIRRPPEQTVLQFADRLEQEDELAGRREAADWYRQYSHLRYSSTPVSSERFREMQSARQVITHSRSSIR